MPNPMTQDLSQLSDRELRVKMAEAMGHVMLVCSWPNGELTLQHYDSMDQARARMRDDPLLKLIPWAQAVAAKFADYRKSFTFNPILDANDREECELWAWEKHGWYVNVEGHDDVFTGWVTERSTKPKFGHLVELSENVKHDGSRGSIIRAEGRATVIAILAALAALGGEGEK